MEENQRVTAQLVLVEGSDVPSTITLHQKDLVIGRGCGCDVTLASLQISRRHATLEYLNRKWFVRDASTNGLTVGSERLTKGVLRELKHQDLVHFIPTGALVYRFEYMDSVIKTESVPVTVTVEDDDDVVLQPVVGEEENSNHSESLLSINDADLLDDYFDDNINERYSGDAAVERSSFNPEELFSGPLGKRKPCIKTEREQELEGQTDKKRKREHTDNDKEDFKVRTNNEDIDILEKELEEAAGMIKSTTSYQSLKGIQQLHSSEDFSQEDIERCKDVRALQNRCTALYHQLKLAEAQNQTLQMEKTIEKEEFLKKQNDAQSRTEAYKEELFKNILECLEHEFSCCICNEIFILPTVVDCGHTFCGFCIGEWTRKKSECPICRKHIRNQTKHVEMDNFLLKIHSMMSEEIRTKRDQTISERLDQKEKAAVRAAQEARGRRNGVPNVDFLHFPQDRMDRLPIPFDLLAELQSINDHPWPPPPNAHNNANNNNANSNSRRRSARIHGRNPAPGNPGPRMRARGIRNRGMEFENMLGLGGALPGGGRNIADDSVITLGSIPAPRPQQPGGMNNNGEPQPGTSRGGADIANNLFFGNNTGVAVPNFRLGAGPGHREFFHMFPFGPAVTRSDTHTTGQQPAHHPPLPSNSNNPGMANMARDFNMELEILLGE